MTGDRTPVPPHRPLRTSENTATPPTPIARSRRTKPAPNGVGVKTKPAARVDLPVESDPTPHQHLPAPSRGTRPNRSQALPTRGLTRPHSHRDDREGCQISAQSGCWMHFLI